MFKPFDHRHGFELRQPVVSMAIKDAIQPRGYIFAFRPAAGDNRALDRARVVFDGSGLDLRDVLVSDLVAG